MSNTPGTPGYAGTSSFPATPGSPGTSAAQITSSQSLANTLKTNFTNILNDYESLTSQLFASIVETAEGRKAERAPVSLMKEIVDLDKKLQDGVSQIEEHQYYHRKILQVQQEIDEENAAIMELVEQLHQGREQLETLLDDARVSMKAMKLASDSPTNIADLLAYAYKVSTYTSAPANSGLNIPLQPPYPTEQRMRRSLLFRQYSSEIGATIIESKTNPNKEAFEEESEEIDASADHQAKISAHADIDNSIEQGDNTEKMMDLSLNPEFE
ncbi:3630_t:CDS:2 [Paraglomus occultum]|uniref:Mediator of RNA polymerase II transcription subunit 4 n=1 Tax=Paraglomus occultum TaxID=144539 RepID=A0A9N8VRU0_9GLOM|nr:3630_t:CDS:2 [Paraglomus occultum]